MKFLLSFIPLTTLLVSCYPLTYTPQGIYNPYGNTTRPLPNNGVTQPNITTVPPNTPAIPPQIPSVKPPSFNTPNVPKPPIKPQLKTPNYPYAQAVPGEKGFVLNPYTGNKVDVSNLSRGTLVRDPHDKNADHKFRVP